jgi:hypothetical protein
VKYSRILSLKYETMMIAVAEAGNKPYMVATARGDRDWRVANDGGKWLVNADSKGPTMGQTPKGADNGSRSKMG